MIEWVPIKDWRNKNLRVYENFLVLLKSERSEELTVEQARFVSSGKIRVLGRCDFENDIEQYGTCVLEITHAAKINFPVEKTLEEKFHDYCKDTGTAYIRTALAELAEIAKQHYEGEK